ncbi:PGF-CTERM sorting domain-containing protein [Halosegnis sp.]|uniref:PGF-CTERM sorting domain-containing protein n=1 Tax=Halosegnis sp. TaxID=2864959 RepID=UPI0035D49526
MRATLVAVTAVLVLSAFVAPAVAADADRADDGAAPVTLTVTVVTPSGDPVGGATIDASWDDGSTTVTTASNGKAFIDVPEGANVSLSAESDEYIRNQPLIVENASAREVTIEVAPKGQLTVAVNDTDGPVEDVRVRLQTDAGVVAEGRTDENGEYTTPAIEQGEYVLRLFKEGYYRNITRETVGESTRLNRSMRRGTTNVQFRVVDDHFSPPRELSDARVEVNGIGSQRLTAGTVTFTLPVNTRYTVVASKDGYTTNETSIFVGAEGNERTLAINREPDLNLTAANDRVVVGETVQVTVRNAYNERVEGATVTVDGETVATTGADGTAAVPIETAGEVTIAASTNGITSNELTIVGVATATATPESTPTATPVSTPTPEGELPVVGQPGFTPVVAVLALLGVGLLVGRRR